MELYVILIKIDQSLPNEQYGSTLIDPDWNFSKIFQLAKKNFRWKYM